jgi:hypothetical protein
MRARRLDELAAAASHGDESALSELLATDVSLYEFFEAKRPPGLQGGPFEHETFRASTALHLAVLGGHIGSARMLIRAGTSVDASDGSGRTPLMYAAMMSDIPMAGFLVEAGADLGLGYNIQSALHVAAFHVDVAMASLLLDAGADIDVCSTDGADGHKYKNTVLYTAFFNKNEAMVRFLLDSGADFLEAHGPPEVALTELARIRLGNTPPESLNFEINTRMYEMFRLEPQRREELRLARCVAFAMGHHPRLGEVSGVLNFDAGVVRMIIENL